MTTGARVRTRGLDGLLLVALLLAGVWLGWALGTRKLGAERAEFARAQKQAVELAQARLKKAQAVGDRLMIELEDARDRARAQAEALNNELADVTDQRVCLREPALRVLERAPGLRVELPAAGGSLAAASERYVTTDTQLAGWAIQAGKQYADCSARLNALIGWHVETGQLKGWQ